MSTEDTTGDMEGGGGSRWSLAAQDLSAEWALKGCRQMEFEGKRVPTLRGIALLARIGKGGMGVVYFGVHPLLRTEVAVKVLPAALLQQREVLVDRFVREAQLAAGLQSEHLVAVRDVGHDNASGCYFIVMEFVRGVSARAWAEGDGRPGGGTSDPPESDALDICIAATRGLAAAHVAGVVHRDIKPDNILLPCDDRGRAKCGEGKLADLGLARAELGGEGLTGKDVAMGTPGFMAPEQVIDARDARKPADVFGIGATLYALLANQAPFKGKSASDALVRTAGGKYPPLRSLRPDVSPAIEMVVDRCLRRKPGERFPDAPALLDALLICRQAIRESGPRMGLDDISTQVVAIAERRERGRKVISTAPPAATVVDDAETGETRLPADDTPPPPPPVTGATVVAEQPPTLDAPLPEQETSEPPPASRAPDGAPAEAPAPEAPPEPADPLRAPSGVTSFGDATQSIALRALDMVGVHEPPPEPEPERKRRGLGLAAAVLVPVALVAAAAIWWGGGDGPAPTPGPGPAPVEPGATGILSVTTAPRGAAVFVGGEERGKTPLRLDDVPAGRHVVRVEAPFFRPKEWKGVPVLSGKTKALHAELSRGTGRVVVDGGPPGGTARLERAGEPAHAVELPLDAGGRAERNAVESGLYRATIVGEGYAPHVVPEDVRVDVDGTARIVPELERLPATLSVDASPAGVQVFVDDEPIGAAPIERHEVTPGGHVVTLRLDEHVSQRLPFTVRAGQSMKIVGIRLAPWPALDLSALEAGDSAWSGADRVRDGQRVEPGDLVLVVRREGHLDQTLRLTARPGRRLRVEPGPWERLTADLDLGDLPDGVTAYLDGNPVSGTVRLPDRPTVTIELRREGFDAQTHEIAVVPGRTARVRPREWTSSRFRLDLRNLRDGVVAEAFGRPLRDGELLNRGRYQVRLRLAGHRDQLVLLDVPNSGDSAVLRAARWVPLPARVDLTRLVAGVSVFVDGRPVRHGETIAPGRHRITLRRAGFVDQEIAAATVSPGGTLVLQAAAWQRAAASPADAARLLGDIAVWASASEASRRQAAETAAAHTRGFRLARMQRFDAGGQGYEIGVFVHDVTGLEFSLIPAGRFRMGSPRSEVGRDVDEIPHAVTLTRPFLMCRTEVPLRVWSKHGLPGGGTGGPDEPATNLNWSNAVRFCDATGLRLPTEAEWEYACRAGTRGPYAFGPDAAAIGGYAWYLENAGRTKQAVGQKRPNAFGLFDMHGNVWEWCHDGYDRYPAGDVTDPTGDPDPRFRVFRGGSNRGKPDSLRSAQRAHRRPGYSDAALGLRPAADVRLR